MKKDHILIPEPSSKFLKVNCKECGEEQVVYSHATTSVTIQEFHLLMQKKLLILKQSKNLIKFLMTKKLLLI